MDSGIRSGLVPAETAMLMRARLTLLTEPMQKNEHGATAQDHEDACLMCAVRALTEGDPAVSWNPVTAGATISGVVLRQGEVAAQLFGKIPFVDLWLGGTGRIRVMAYATLLRHALDRAAAQIGDRLQICFDGESAINRPGHPTHGRPYKRFTVNVQRGH